MGLGLDPDAMPSEELARLKADGYGHLISKSFQSASPSDLIAQARRELWWFIEGDGDIDRVEAASHAIRIQDDLLGQALEKLRGRREDRNRLRDALTWIAENAQAWHGPPQDRGQGRALKVIAEWARDALGESKDADASA